MPTGENNLHLQSVQQMLQILRLDMLPSTVAGVPIFLQGCQYFLAGVPMEEEQMEDSSPPTLLPSPNGITLVKVKPQFLFKCPHLERLQKEERRLSSGSTVMLSPRGEKTTPTLLQPRQPVLRESQNIGNDDAVFDGDDEKEDDDDERDDGLDYIYASSLISGGVWSLLSSQKGISYLHVCMLQLSL